MGMTARGVNKKFHVGRHHVAINHTPASCHNLTHPATGKHPDTIWHMASLLAKRSFYTSHRQTIRAHAEIGMRNF